MATSPLIAATKPVASSLDQDQPSSADMKYNMAMQRIVDALDAREAKGYNPTMLAIAQGLLTPGQTGSFFEGAGKAAGNVQQQQKEAQKEELDNAQMRLQLAQAEREQEQLTRAQKGFQQLTGGAPRAGGAGGAEGEAGAPSQDQFRTVSVQDALKFAAAFPKNEKMASLLMDAAKAGSDRYKIAMNGTVFDSWSGKYVTGEIPGQTASEYNIPGVGLLKMTPNQYSQYEAARQAGVGQQWIKDFMSPTGPSKAPAAPSAVSKPDAVEAPAGTEPIVVKNQADLEAEAAGKKRTAEGRSTEENKRYSDIMNQGKEATNMLANSKTLETAAKQPGMADALGYFERPDFLSAVGKYIEQPGKVLTVPNLREILINLKAPQSVIDNVHVLNSLVNQNTVAFRRLAQGQGAISNQESQLYASLGPDTKDPINAFLKKNAMLAERAKFQQEVAKTLRKSNMNADDFILSPQYQDLTQNYYNSLQKIVSPSTSGSTKPKASEQLRKELGIQG